MRHALDCSTGAGLMRCDCGAHGWMAYKTAPHCERIPETSIGQDGEVLRWWRVVRWIERGTVEGRDEIEAMRNAKARFGGSPVLERL